MLRLLAASVVLVASLVAWRSALPSFSSLFTRVAGSPVHPAKEKLAAARKSRLIYPYSVIRGGVYDANELRDALDHDPVAARHYFGFRRSLVHPAVSPFSEPVFLSYRVGNAIYWTSRPVRLPRGEAVLTDGEHYARARCGNRISPAPQTPVNDTEPPPKTMDIPEPPPGKVVDLETWSENRLLPAETPEIMVPPVPVTVSAVPGAVGEVQTNPLWWVATGPSGFLSIPIVGSIPRTLLPPPSTPVIQPNPIPYVPLPPGPTIPGSPVAMIPIESSPPFEIWPSSPTVPSIPIGPLTPTIPTGPSEAVPEPALMPVLILAFGALAWARLQRKS